MVRYRFKATFKDREDRVYCVETAKESYYDAHVKALEKMVRDVGHDAAITSLVIISFNPVETFREVFSKENIDVIDHWIYDGSLFRINESLSDDEVSIYEIITPDDIKCYFKKAVECEWISAPDGDPKKCGVYTIYFGRFKCCFSTKANNWEVWIYDWDSYKYTHYSIGSKICCAEAISDLLTSEYELIIKMRKVCGNPVMPMISDLVMPMITRDMLR